MPAELMPPQQEPLIGKYAAKGVQIYELTDAQGRPFAKHYAGPTWEAPDGSKTVGKVLTSEPAPKAGAIPWLLLSTKSSRAGNLPVHVLSSG
jgi:hypothetical protein